MTADQILEAKRSHWAIENGLHWVLDMQFREDESRARSDSSAENLNVLRHLAFTSLMQENERERAFKTERLALLQEQLERAEKESAAQTDWAAVLRKYLNLQVLDRTAVDELIDHIEVGERTDAGGNHRQNVKVFYRFADSTQR